MPREVKDIERKSALVVVRDTTDEGVYEIDISTESTDRDGDVIEVEGWQLENYRKNPVVMWAHSYRTVPIGKALDVVKAPPVLRASFMFREPANEFDPVLPIKAAWDQGILRAASVGFRPLKMEPINPDDDSWFAPMRFIEQELLEFSIVPIPANQDALRLAFDAYVKGLGLPSDGSANVTFDNFLDWPKELQAEWLMEGGSPEDSNNTANVELSEEERAALEQYLKHLKLLLGV
jgi:hypothetical protein